MTFTADGNTLTISGYGDLTTFSKSNTIKVFSEAANGKVRVGQWDTNDVAGTEYDATKQYYTGTGEEIKDNSAFFEEHPEYLVDKVITTTFAQLLANQINSGSYKTIKFLNTSSSEALKLDSKAINAILYVPKSRWGQSWNEVNSNLLTLDLGQVTCDDLSSETFAKPEKGANGTYNLESITLPLTKTTIVKSETTGKDVEKMVLPTKVLEPLAGVATLTKVIIPEGYHRLGEQAFLGCANVKDFVFPTSLQVIGNFAFKNCGALQELNFVKGLENIGKEAFYGANISSVTFPSTLKIIDDGAFLDCKNLKAIKFNAGLKYIGNSAFALNSELNETTLEIPASVKYIGPFAFNFRQYQDVYFYGQTAPIMPLGDSPYIQQCKDGSAFSEHTLDGNTGFDPSSSKNNGADDTSIGYANRENYFSGHAYFCILHYPKDLTDDQRQTYTDVTRIYKTDPSDKFHASDTDSGWNGTEGADIVGQETESITFGKVTTVSKRVNWGYQDTYLGSQYIWPSQAQFSRAYATASNGLCWNGVTKYRTTLTDEDLAILKYAGYVVGDGEGEYTLDELQKIAHMGTRQFVLTNADVNVDKDEDEEPTYPISMEGGKWWTICVPFNMTKAQVDKTFGEGTHVCRFNKVERLQDQSNNRYLKLYFTNDVYVHKSTKDENGNYTTATGTAVEDDDIVIYAHESYMIFPTLDNKDANNMYNISDYQLVTGSPVPTIVEANKDWKNVEGGSMKPMEEDDETVEDRTYRFVGNYQAQVLEAQSTTEQNSGVATLAAKNVTVPQFSFIYAKKKGYSRYQFWFYYGTQMAWSPNKCVVQATAKSGGMSDAEQFYGLEKKSDGSWGKKTDSATASKKINEQSFFGTEGETTGIDNVVIIAGDGNNSEVVYNLNGQVVNNKGNMDGLQKGIYIMNGKKYMVK